MKRLYSVILVLSLLLMLAACGGGGAYEGEITESVIRNYQVTDADDFSYDADVGGVRITEYTGSDTIVVVPESIDGEKVVSFAAVVFGNESQVRGVMLPSGVKELEMTFTNNSVLEMVIWESAEVIGPNTFNNCASLRGVILGDSLTSIGENGFSFCSSLEELYVAPSMQQMDKVAIDTAFFGCSSLTITGEAGSFIEGLCAEQGIPFKAK